MRSDPDPPPDDGHEWLRADRPLHTVLSAAVHTVLSAQVTFEVRGGSYDVLLGEAAARLDRFGAGRSWQMTIRCQPDVTSTDGTIVQWVGDVDAEVVAELMVWTPVPPGAIGGQEVRMLHAVARRKQLGMPRTIAALANDLGVTHDRADVLIGRLCARGLLYQPPRKGAGGHLTPMFTCHPPLTAEQQKANRLARLREEREAYA